MHELKTLSPPSKPLSITSAWGPNPIESALHLLISKKVVDKQGSFIINPAFPLLEECREICKQVLKKTTALLREKHTLVGRSVKEVGEKLDIKIVEIPDPIELTFTLEGLLQHLQQSKDVGPLIQSFDIVGGSAMRILKDYLLEVCSGIFTEHKINIEELNPLLLTELDQPAIDLDLQIGIIEATLKNREHIMNAIIAYLADQIPNTFDDSAYLEVLKQLKPKYKYINYDSKTIRHFSIREFVLHKFSANVIDYQNQFSFARIKDKDSNIIDLLARAEQGNSYKRECLYRSNAARISCINNLDTWTIVLKTAHGIYIPQMVFDLVMGIQYPPDLKLVGADDLGRVSLKSYYGRGLIQDGLTTKIIQAALKTKDSPFNRFKSHNLDKSIDYFYLLLKHCWDQHQQPGASAVYYLFNASMFLQHTTKTANADLRHLWEAMVKGNLISFKENEPIERIVVQAIVKEAIPFGEISAWMQPLLLCFAPSTLIKWEESIFAFRFKKLIFIYDPLKAFQTINDDIIPKIESHDHSAELFLELLNIVLNNQDSALNYPSAWLENPLEFKALLKDQDELRALAGKWILSSHPYIAYLGATCLLALPDDKLPDSSMDLLLNELPKLMLPIDKIHMQHLMHHFALATQDSKELSRCITSMNSTIKNLYVRKIDSFLLCWLENLAECKDPRLLHAAWKQFIKRGQLSDSADVSLGLKIFHAMLQDPKNDSSEALELANKLLLTLHQREDCFVALAKAKSGLKPVATLIAFAAMLATKSSADTSQDPQALSAAFAWLIQNLFDYNATKAEDLLLLCSDNKLLLQTDLMGTWLAKLEHLQDMPLAQAILQAQKLAIFQSTNGFPLLQERLTKIQLHALEKLKAQNSILLSEPLFVELMLQQAFSQAPHEAAQTATLLLGKHPSTISMLKAVLTLLQAKNLSDGTLCKRLFKEISLHGDRELKEACGKMVQDEHGQLINRKGFIKFDDEAIIYVLQGLASLNHASLNRYIKDDCSFQRFLATFYNQDTAFKAFEIIFAACIPQFKENDSLHEDLMLRCHTLEDWGWQRRKNIDIALIRHWISAASLSLRSFAAERLELLLKEEGLQNEWRDLLEPSFYLPYLKQDKTQSSGTLNTEKHAQACRALLQMISSPEKLFEYQLLLNMDVKNSLLPASKQYKAFQRCLETLLSLNTPRSVYWAAELLTKAAALFPSINSKVLETLFEKTLIAAQLYPDFYIAIHSTQHVASALMNLSEVLTAGSRQALRDKYLQALLVQLDTLAKKANDDWRLLRYKTAYVKLASKIAQATDSQKLYHQRAHQLLPLCAQILVTHQHLAMIDQFFDLFSNFKGQKKFTDEKTFRRAALDAFLKELWTQGEVAMDAIMRDKKRQKSPSASHKVAIAEQLLKYQAQICKKAYRRWGISETISPRL